MSDLLRWRAPEAIDTVGLFTGRGAIVQTKDYAGALKFERSVRALPAFSGAFVVLVDRGTASGAEIIAGALQNYGAASGTTNEIPF